MKQLLSILIILFCTGLVSAQNILFIDTSNAGPNQTVLISVKINNEKSFTAFQLDITLPEVLQYQENSAVLEPSRKADHLLSTSVLSNNVLRLIAFSATGKDFSGNNGTVISFSCSTKQVPGSYSLIVSNVIISDFNNKNIADGTNNGLFSLMAPLLSVDQTAIDFGSIPLTQTASRAITVTNSGNLPLLITAFSSNLGEIKFTDSGSVTIAANQTINKTVLFVPVIKGTKTGGLTIASNSVTAPSRSISVKGSAYAVNEIHVGNLQGRSGYQANLLLSINNMEPFSAFECIVNLPSSMKLSFGSAKLFRQSDHLISVDTIGPTKLKVVAFSPANKNFSGNSGNVAELDFNLIGTGGSYPVTVSGAIIADSNGSNIISASYDGNLQIASPLVQVNTAQLNFGPVSIADTGRMNFSISNYGNDTLKISSLTFDSNVFYNATNFPIFVLPNNSITFPVFFHSNTRGKFSSRVTVYHNDFVRNPSVIGLAATAFNPNILVAQTVAGIKGDTISLLFSIKNTDAFTAFQFDVTLPQGIEFIPGSLLLGARASVNHTISSSFINTATIRVIAWSLNQSLFGGDSGIVCSFKVKLGAGFGSYPIAIDNAIIGDVDNQNIISSVQNGTLTILPVTKISGKALYNSDAKYPLPGVMVYLQNGNAIIDSSVTESNGKFTFKNVFDGTYRITAKSSKPVSGITSADALLIRRYTVGLARMAKLQLQAADVNSSGTVNSSDALLIRRFIVGQISSFSNGNWIFESPVVSISGADAAIELLGNISGDVDGSLIP